MSKEESMPYASYHHKPIKMFYLNGVIHDDSMIGRLREEYIRLLSTEMKLSGYVRRLDLDPDFTIRYNELKNFFEFELSLQAVYAGKRKSEWIAGIDGTNLIPILQSKSSESLQDRVLP
jgi:hypothetical protein